MAPTGNRTGGLLLCRVMPNQLSHTGQGGVLVLRAPSAHVLPSFSVLERNYDRASKEFKSPVNEKLTPQFTEYLLCTKLCASQLIPVSLK